VVSLDNCNGCARCFEDCPYSAIRMAPRTDGKGYETQAEVNPDNCMSCGLCVGACPTATPFRRAGEIIAGIELPEYPVAGLRERTIAASKEFVKGRRILVYACEHSNSEALENDNARVITLPCVAALPPSFIDFALSRNLADGVAISGCADGDCFYRLGGDWMQQRIDGDRDPYLRRRVDRERVRHWRHRACGSARADALDEFASDLKAMPKNHPGRRSADA
jgi:ferredoxin/coenzyme F420-reducing hydrogenase delta subunit